MAMTELKWEYIVTFADNSGVPLVTRTYEAPFAAFADFDAFQSATGAIDTYLAILSQAVIAAKNYKLVVVNDALTLPASGIENENQAFFSGKIFGDPTDSATQSIPAAAPGIFVATSGPGANVVNMAHATVVAWVALFDSNGPWSISDGEAWVNPTVKGKRRHSKSTSS